MKKDFTLLLKETPLLIQEEYVKMSASRKEAFEEDFLNRVKCLVTSYAAGIFFGSHYLYLKKIGQQALLWLLLIVGFTYCVILPIFLKTFTSFSALVKSTTLPFMVWIIVLGCFSLLGLIWWIISLIKMPVFIKNYNREQALISLKNVANTNLS